MIRALAAFALIVLVLIAGLIGALLWFPGPLLRAGLRAAGVATVAFEAVHIGPTTLELTGLRIGPPPGDRLESLRIRYRLSDLLHGRIASIEAEGLKLHGRIAEGRLEIAGLEGGSPGGPGGGFGLPAWPQEVVLRTAEVQLETPWGTLTLPVAGTLRPGRPEAEFSISVAGGQLTSGAGRLHANLDLEGHLPLDANLTLAAVSARGHVDLAAEDFAAPGLAAAIEGRGEITFTLEGGRIDARVGAAEVNVGALAAPLAGLEEALPTPWRIRPDAGPRAIRITGPLDPDAGDFAIAGGLDLAAGRARVEADLDASLRTGAPGGLPAGEAKATLNLGEIRWRGLELASGRLGLQVEGSRVQWHGGADLDLAGGGAPTPAIAIDAARLSQKLALTFADDRLTLAASEPGRLTLERLTWPEGGRAGPLAIRLEPGDPPLLVATLGPDGEITWQQTLRAASEAFDLAVPRPPFKGRATIAELTLAASGDEHRLNDARLEIAGGRLQLPEQQITLEGIATSLALAADGLAPGQVIPVAVASISQGGGPAWFAPLALAGTLRPNAGGVDFEARLSRSADEFVLTLRGRQDLAKGEGQARLSVAPLTFVRGGRQPRRLAPRLGDRLRDFAGKVALDGTLAWGKGDQIRADLDLLLDSLGFTAGPARFEQVNGVVHLDRLWPLTTPPGQQLAIGLLDFGLPLTAGLIGFRVDPDQSLAVEQLRWSFAGGTVSARPFRVGSVASDIKVTLTADGLDLGQLLALTRLDALSGDGRIHGSLPVHIKDGVAVIEGGELASDRPGWLRYRPATPPSALQAGGANVSLLLQALENFRYEALRITLDGRTDAAITIGLHVRGANPALYGGYPIEFNLNLEGELANILRSGLATYQIPQRIREQMRGFQR